MAPRRQVEDLPGLNATSNPATSLQGAIAFAPRDNSLLDLAQSLKGINRQLGSYFDKQIEQQNDAAIAEGKRLAMLDDAKSYKQYVEKGGEPMASPWVQYGYKQQKGRVLGQSHDAFLSDKYMNWEGAGSDDINGQSIVEAMPKWRQEFLQSVGDLDPVEQAGFDAYSITAEDNLVRQHIANERKQSMENYETQVYNEFYNLLSDPKLDQQQLHAKIEEVYQRQEFQGLRNMVAPLLLQATTDLAKSGDTSAVAKVREFTRKDAKTGQVIPIMKNTKAKAVLDDAEATAKRAAISANNLAKAQEDDARRANNEQFSRTVVERVVDNRGKLDELSIAREALESGADGVDALRLARELNRSVENTRDDATDAIRNRIFSDITMSRVPMSFASMRDKQREMEAAGGTREDIAAVYTAWEKYQKSGKTLYDQYPELESLAASQVNKYDGISADQANLVMAKAVTKALIAKTPPDKVPERAAALFKTDMATYKSRIEALRRGDAFAPGADNNMDGTKGTKPAAKAATKVQPNTQQSEVGVASVAEIRGLKGAPREEQDAFLATKPIIRASLMAQAFRATLSGSRTPELTKVLDVAEKLGIDTSDPEQAIYELMDRGQGKFFPVVTAARERAKARSQQNK